MLWLVLNGMMALVHDNINIGSFFATVPEHVFHNIVIGLDCVIKVHVRQVMTNDSPGHCENARCVDLWISMFRAMLLQPAQHRDHDVQIEWKFI